ncbi:MAG: DUF3488 domain-containing protein [Nitrospirota bacterium]|nr:MAG: DUF3488 domain-containing protein [Nitrospirota bacterium]
MPGTYKLFTAFVAFIGSLSLVLTGELNPFFSFVGTGLVWGYIRALKGLPYLPKKVSGGLSFLTFMIFLADFVMTGDMINAVAHMTLVFQTIKSFDIKDPWDPPQVFFMSLLQLLLASELTSAIYFGVLFVIFLVLIVIAVLLGHFVKEGQMIFRPYLRPIVAVTMIILVLTSLFFIALPRLRSSIWGKSYTKSVKTAGFSERVDFGSFGAIKMDQTVVIRMILDPDIKGSHYLRGSTFDYFDGTAWYDTVKETMMVYRRANQFQVEVPDDLQKFEALLFLEPMDSDVIFTYKMPYKLEAQGWLILRNNAGSFTMKRKIAKRFNYKLSSVDGYYADNTHLVEYLQYPEGFDSTRDLARKVTNGAVSDLDRSLMIRDHLKKNFKYSLFSEIPERGSNAIEHFLFRSKKGYCEHFATAMAIMLRSVGVPSRLVTGYLSDQRNDIGDYYLIRQSDAHSWVEAYIEDKWISFDPTPSVPSMSKFSLMLLLDMINMNWNRYVVGFSNYDQARLVNYFGGFGRRPDGGTGPAIKWIAIPVFIVLLGYGIVLMVRKFSVSNPVQNKVTAEYLWFRKRIMKRGGRVSLSSTSDEVQIAALRKDDMNENDVERFISAYKELRFSGRIDTGLLDEYLSISKKFREG